MKPTKNSLRLETGMACGHGDREDGGMGKSICERGKCNRMCGSTDSGIFREVNLVPTNISNYQK